MSASFEDPHKKTTILATAWLFIALLFEILQGNGSHLELSYSKAIMLFRSFLSNLYIIFLKNHKIVTCKLVSRILKENRKAIIATACFLIAFLFEIL